MLDSFARGEGYDWIFAEAESGTLQAFNIRSQATYVGIAPDGAIVASSGGGSGKDWPSILDQLSGA